jgi:hypothetical protein
LESPRLEAGRNGASGLEVRGSGAIASIAGRAPLSAGMKSPSGRVVPPLFPAGKMPAPRFSKYAQRLFADATTPNPGFLPRISRMTWIPYYPCSPCHSWPILCLFAPAPRRKEMVTMQEAGQVSRPRSDLRGRDARSGRRGTYPASGAVTKNEPFAGLTLLMGRLNRKNRTNL